MNIHTRALHKITIAIYELRDLPASGKLNAALLQLEDLQEIIINELRIMEAEENAIERRKNRGG